MLLGDRPPLVGRDIGPELGDLLLDGLRLLLPLGGHGHIARYPHPWLLPGLPLAASPPSAGGVGRPDPTEPAHPAARSSPAGPARYAAWLPLPAAKASVGGVHASGDRSRSGRRHQSSRSWPWRVQQNLSLVIRPSSAV